MSDADHKSDPPGSADRADTELDRLAKPVRRMTRRVIRRTRWNRGLERLATGLFCTTMAAAVGLTLWKLGWIGPNAFGWMAGVPFAATLAWSALAARAAVDPVSAARKLDRSHHLDDRLSTAISLLDGAPVAADVDRNNRRDSAINSSDSTDTDAHPGFVLAQLRDAARAAGDVAPDRAEPIDVPRDTRMAVVGVGLLCALATVQPPDHRQPLPEPPTIQHGVVLDDTSIALARDRLEDLRDDPDIAKNEETSEAVEELAELLELADEQAISADEFRERLDAIESQLEDAEADDRGDRLADDLSDLAEQLNDEATDSLEDFPDLKAAAESLENKDFEGAAEQLDKLAEKLSTSPEDGGMSEAKRKKLSEMMRRMGGSLSDEQLEELYEQNKSLADQFDAPDSDRSLGGRSGDGERDSSGSGSDSSRSASNSSKSDGANREKNRLNDDRGEGGGQQRAGADEGSSESERQLQRLRRRAERAANRSRDRGSGETGAKADGGRSSEQNQAGRNRRRDGRQQKGREGSEGQKQRRGERRRAGNGESTDQTRGQRGGRQQRDSAERRRGESRSDRRGGRDQSQRSGNSGRQRVEREIDRMRESMRRSRSNDQRRSRQANGDSSGSRSDRVRKFIRRARGDNDGEQSSERRATKSGENRSGNTSGSSSDGQGQSGGNQAGRGSSQRLDDSGESLDDVERDPSKASSRQGAGPTRRQVIESTSDQGFARTEYRDVYAEYEDVAEEIMEREDVPRGYRFYIQRYFELIRPRSASPSEGTTDE